MIAYQRGDISSQGCGVAFPGARLPLRDETLHSGMATVPVGSAAVQFWDGKEQITAATKAEFQAFVAVEWPRLRLFARLERMLKPLLSEPGPAFRRRPWQPSVYVRSASQARWPPLPTALPQSCWKPMRRPHAPQHKPGCRPASSCHQSVFSVDAKRAEEASGMQTVVCRYACR